MRIKIFILLLLTISPYFASAAVNVSYKISPTHGLLNFVLAVANEPRTAPALKEIFRKSSFNNKKNQLLIADFNELKPLLSISVDFPLSVPTRPEGTTVLRQMIVQSIFASDLSNLSQRMLGLMPIAAHKRIFEILEKFEPIYRTLIWNKSLEDLKDHQAKLEELGRNIQLNDMFFQAEHFYGGQWPEDVPFIIGLYPIPYIQNFRNNTISSSLGSIEEHGVMVGNKSDDISGSFGVVFHELCHSLYASQPIDFQKSLASWFAASKSPYRHHAANWFDEALATAVGNAWAYSKANPTGQNEDWYNDPTIEGYAKEIYPLVNFYLQQKKTLDQAFVDRAIASFAKRFPESIDTFETILTKIILVTDGHALSVTEARDSLRANFDMRSISGSSPINHRETIQSLAESSSPVLMVFSPNKVTQLKSLENPIVTSNYKTLEKMKNRSYFSAMDKDSRVFIFIKVQNKAEFIAALDKMKSLKKIDPRNPLVEF